jgi:hypothetical protein
VIKKSRRLTAERSADSVAAHRTAPHRTVPAAGTGRAFAARRGNASRVGAEGRSNLGKDANLGKLGRRDTVSGADDDRDRAAEKRVGGMQDFGGVVPLLSRVYRCAGKDKRYRSQCQANAPTPTSTPRARRNPPAVRRALTFGLTGQRRAVGGQHEDR